MDQKDLRSFFEGREIQAYDYFGAHIQGNKTLFRVYAPHAQAVYLIGEFNDWQTDSSYRMEKDEFGFFSIVASVSEGMAYKYRIIQSTGRTVDKMDPFAFQSELRPNTASVVSNASHTWQDEVWMKARSKDFDRPLNVYELHLGSWKKAEDQELVSYMDVVDDLIAYCHQHHFTHVECMPLCEYPFDGSWGYQCTGYFSPTARYGRPEDLMAFVDRLHQANIGVIMDYVPVHFVTDDYALARFDGSSLYEYEKDEDAKSEWGTLNFDLWKESVRSFLMSAANYWLDVYHFDGLRMDAIANAIFWHGNKARGVNEGAIHFMKRMNYLLNEAHNYQILLIAEDSSDFPKVTHSQLDGGLGFDYKWDLGWMNDTLGYLKKDPIYRQYHHHDLTFSMAYFGSERFILPLSHDEVVHGKATIVDKMWGSYEDKFAQARALYVYMFAHPGKKLNFMGNEIGQLREWDEQKECDWFLLKYPMHDAFHHFFQVLGQLYAENDAFWQHDYDGQSFEWVDADNTNQNLYSFIRKGRDKDYLIVLNFSTNDWPTTQLGVLTKGVYHEVLNTQWACFNGSYQEEYVQTVHTVKLSRHRKPYMVQINVPALCAQVFECEKD